MKPPAWPERIGRYPILGELGSGASAVVYLAQDPESGRKLAVKVARSDSSRSVGEEERFRKLFLNEASLAGKLHHPNIVAVLDAVVDGEVRYIVMEYVPGGSLKRFCNETNLLPVRQAAMMIFKCCRALDYAFQNGVIHRDIKPGNILLGEGGEIKLSDFGAAHIAHGTHTQLSGFLGSPAYMAPEQIEEHPPTAQSDIYSLGVVMYELLAGRLPFQAANSVAMIHKILHEDPIPLASVRPDVPPRLTGIVARAMDKDPARRYGSWFEMARDLLETFPQLEAVSEQISASEKFSRLRELEFFRPFKDAEVWEVLRGSSWAHHGRGEPLLDAQASGCFAMLVSGQARLCLDGEFLRALKAGDCFVDPAFFGMAAGKPILAVFSVSEVQVLRLQSRQLALMSEGCQLRFHLAFLQALNPLPGELLVRQGS